MKKNWKTTLAGLLLASSMFLQQSGVKIGHVGNTDVVGLIQIAAAAILGAYSKDKDVSGTGAQAKRDPQG
jgi:hypothetical protein